jgi:hypothetical protein
LQRLRKSVKVLPGAAEIEVTIDEAIYEVRISG